MAAMGGKPITPITGANRKSNLPSKLVQASSAVKKEMGKRIFSIHKNPLQPFAKPEVMLYFILFVINVPNAKIYGS
jgi:hypothetical protein